MTLIEIAKRAADLTGLTDDESVEQAKTFTRDRWQMIWDSNLWRQARHQQFLTVPAGAEEVAVDALFGLVTSVTTRGSNAHELLAVGDSEAIARGAHFNYESAGEPIYYLTLPRTEEGLKIQLMPKPARDVELMVLGKRVCPKLEKNDDAPLIAGVDQALTAFAVGDMLEWMRMFGKAQMKFQEATAHVQKMVEIERAQSAGFAQLVPMNAEPYGEWES